MFQHPAFNPFAEFEDNLRATDAEIAHLFRQAGVHVIHMLKTEKFTQRRAHQHRLFMRMNANRTGASKPSKRLSGMSKKIFRIDGPIFHIFLTNGIFKEREDRGRARCQHPRRSDTLRGQPHGLIWKALANDETR